MNSDLDERRAQFDSALETKRLVRPYDTHMAWAVGRQKVLKTTIEELKKSDKERVRAEGLDDDLRLYNRDSVGGGLGQQKKEGQRKENEAFAVRLSQLNDDLHDVEDFMKFLEGGEFMTKKDIEPMRKALECRIHNRGIRSVHKIASIRQPPLDGAEAASIRQPRVGGTEAASIRQPRVGGTEAASIRQPLLAGAEAASSKTWGTFSYSATPAQQSVVQQRTPVASVLGKRVINGFRVMGSGSSLEFLTVPASLALPVLSGSLVLPGSLASLAQPVVSAQAVAPASPAQPVAPASSVSPVVSAQPVAPVQPAAPTLPAKPAQTVAPASPAKPAPPVQPVALGDQVMKYCPVVPAVEPVAEVSRAVWRSNFVKRYRLFWEYYYTFTPETEDLYMGYLDLPPTLSDYSWIEAKIAALAVQAAPEEEVAVVDKTHEDLRSMQTMHEQWAVYKQGMQKVSDDIKRYYDGKRGKIGYFQLERLKAQQALEPLPDELGIGSIPEAPLW